MKSPLRDFFAKLDDDFILKVLNATCNEKDMETFVFFLCKVAEAKGIKVK